ncbi:MAG TPA: UPF0182 family protein [Dehalococcoidia bacterium]|nr:UPF0182 family protein [Dehalococcoidia bacterium]
MAFDFGRGREGEDFGPPPPPFRIRRQRSPFAAFGDYNRWVFLGVALLLLYIVLNTAKGLYVDWLWFEGAGYRSVYSKMLTTRLWLFFGGAGLFLVYFGFNAYIAARSVLRLRPAAFADFDAAALRRLYLLGLIAGSLFLAIIFGTIASSEWMTVLQYLNRQSFGVEDPQFGRDVSFFVFTLPALDFAQDWLLGVAVMTTLVCAALYLSRFLLIGVRPEEERPSKAHLCFLLIVVVGLFIWRYWLSTFELSFSENGPVFGATYADVKARLPFIWVSAAMAVITIGALAFAVFTRGVVVPMAAMGAWVVVAVIGTVVYPAFVQRFSVQPNELELERPYIQRNIEMTRSAFGLDAIEERQFPAAPEVTPQEIAQNPETIQNIRLLDVRPLLQTYAQIQTIRPLYEFRDVDIDRYTIDGQRRQVLIAARELSPGRLPPTAQTWVNRRLQFTHGYGVVMSPVNEVVQEGLPELFMRDIPVVGKLPLTRPEIYYGEEPDHYVIVKTRAKEFDYPIGEGSAESVFEGEGGVQLSSLFRRLIFAWEFGDVNIAISDSLTDESRLLWRRNIKQRVQTLAPFLRLDKDPYIVVADGRLYWIQDAYTATSRYPYSTPVANLPAENQLNGANYVRNSVKVVIDAYDGTTTFYIADETDAMIQTYAKTFPRLFTSLDRMPASLRAHLRYPEDLFLAQVNVYRTYHIKEANALYNREDIWSVPNEVFEGGEVPVQPYYVIMRIPGEAEPEFALILPLVPARRSNTIAWVAARSDGANYGKLLAFRFPTDTLVFGPRQVESRIDQDAQISAQFSLWERAGSRVIRGNLLMIPIGNGNLYVEPIYLRAETSQLPELKRVVIVNGNRIAMEPTLDRALEVIFGRAAPTAPTADAGAGPPSAAPTPGTPGVPAATATPRPATTPGNVADLARQAEEAFARAQAALRNGDLATYQQEINRAQELVQQIARQVGQ